MTATDNISVVPQHIEGSGIGDAVGGGCHRKTSSSSSQKSAESSGAAARAESLRCPRCDSTQTKFCYYNNYSLTQPRHFCKACRRYWTKGGALRNVPVGGGCRKNKKVRTSSTSLPTSSTSRLLTSFQDPKDFGDINGLRFYHGFTSTPAVDFQLGGSSFSTIQSTVPTSAPPPTATYTQQLSSFTDMQTSNSGGYGLDLMARAGGGGGSISRSTSLGLNNYQISGQAVVLQAGEASGKYGVSPPMDTRSNNLATSIESLSSMNQELHRKLQQQRLALLYGQDQDHHDDHEQNRESDLHNNFGINHQQEKPQPIMFQNLDMSKGDHDQHHHHVNYYGANGSGGSVNGNDICGRNHETHVATATEWFFDTPYASSVTVAGAGTGEFHEADGATPTSTVSGATINDESVTTNFMQAWTSNNNHHHYRFSGVGHIDA